MRWILLTAILLAGCSSKPESQDKQGKQQQGKNGQDKKGDAKGQGSGSSDQKGGNTQQVVLEGDAQRRAGIEVADIVPRRQAQTLTASGRITVNEERTAHVGAYSEGRITEVMANPGDVVRKGQVLARMHSHDVHEAIAAYARARAEIARQRGLVSFAQRSRDRYRRLLELKSASVLEVDRADSEWRGAQTDLRNAETELEKERTHITDVLQIPLPDEAGGQLTEAQELVPIKASISGTVIARQVSPGAVVTLGMEAFTISDLSQVWMLAAVNEHDVAKVQVGMPVRVFADAYKDTAFRGRVTRLGTQLDPGTRTLQVRVVLPNPQGRLRTEMYVTAELGEASTREGIFLPEEALQDINGSTVVFVRRNGREFAPRVVEVAHRVAGEAEISGGLKAGEAVAVKGSFMLKSQLLKSTLGEE